MTGMQPPAMGEAQWLYVINGQQLGPVPTSALLNMIMAGTIKPQTQVWREGLEAWAPAGGMPELAYAFRSAPLDKKAEAALGLTTTGLIVFIVLIVFCFPLCWLPWVIKDLKARP